MLTFSVTSALKEADVTELNRQDIMKQTLRKISFVLIILTSIGVYMMEDICTVIAQTYIPMIREDRVWEYRSGCPEPSDRESFFTMKFEGTVNCKGKQYHAFVKKEEKLFRHTEDHLSDTDDIILITEQIYTDDGVKYFVREEEGKVFVLTKWVNYEESTGFEGYWSLYCTTDGLSSLNLPGNPDNTEYSETLIYDSTIMDSGGFLVQYVFLSNGDPVAYQSNFYCKQFVSGTIEIEGEICRKFDCYGTLDPDNVESQKPGGPNALSWIEGIGTLSKGCVPYYSINMIAGGNYYDLCEPGPFSRLQSVCTLDGEVIYGNPPICNGITRNAESDLKIDVLADKITVKSIGVAYMVISSMDGIEVISASGINEVALPNAGLARGVYVVTATDATSTRTLKIRL